MKQLPVVLMSAPRMGQILREDKLIGMVRQRLHIPGGCYNFDVPTLRLWLHQPQAQKQQVIDAWLRSLSPLKNSLDQVLELIRHSDIFRAQTSLSGFFQDNAVDADLIRLQLAIEHQFYPRYQAINHALRFAFYH